MKLAQVTGRLWNDRDVCGMSEHRLVTVRTLAEEQDLVAVDLVDAAAGDLVLLAADEGAQAAVGGPAAGVDLAAVALIAGADVLPARATRESSA